MYFIYIWDADLLHWVLPFDNVWDISDSAIKEGFIAEIFCGEENKTQTCYGSSTLSIMAIVFLLSFVVHYKNVTWEFRSFKSQEIRSFWTIM